MLKSSIHSLLGLLFSEERMYRFFDEQMDDSNIAVEHRPIASRVAFLLSFVSELTSDNEATVASKRGFIRI